MKSFAVKRDEKDPRWAKFIEWGNEQRNVRGMFAWDGLSIDCYYGFSKRNRWLCSETEKPFDRILTLEEWEAEFVNKLAGREYDEKLLRQWHLNACLPIDIFLNQRYAKPDRIAEIKAKMEKLSNELKELEG